MSQAVLNLDVGDFWLWTGLLAALAVGAFFASFNKLRRARLIEDTPTSLIRSAAQGYVELIGTAKLLEGPPIFCPLTMSACIWWHYKIEKKVRSNRRTHWQTVVDRTSDALFLLVDDTGQCIVDPDGAEVKTALKRVWYGHSKQPSGPPGKSGILGSVFGDYRYTERLIHENDPLYAIGKFRSEGGYAEIETEEAVQALLKDWKQDQAKLLNLFDVDKDGQIDATEWEAARRVALRRVRDDQLAQAGRPLLNVISQPTDGRVFLLSSESQADLGRGYRIGAALSFLFFLAGGAGAVWLLIARGIL